MRPLIRVCMPQMSPLKRHFHSLSGEWIMQNHTFPFSPRLTIAFLRNRWDLNLADFKTKISEDMKPRKRKQYNVSINIFWLQFEFDIPTWILTPINWGGGDTSTSSISQQLTVFRQASCSLRLSRSLGSLRTMNYTMADICIGIKFNIVFVCNKYISIGQQSLQWYLYWQKMSNLA